MPLPENKTTDAAVSFRHPLKHFKGHLADIIEDPRLNKNTGKVNTFIKFQFEDITVIEANEPYVGDTTEIEVMELNMANSAWEVLKQSIRECGYSGSLNGLINKDMELEFRPALLSQRKFKLDDQNNPVQDEQGRYVYDTGYENRPGDAWQVNSIEGVAYTGDVLLAWTIDFFEGGGRNEDQFKASFMAEDSIRSLSGYGEVMTKVMTNNYLPALIESGVLVKEANGDIRKV